MTINIDDIVVPELIVSLLKKSEESVSEPLSTTGNEPLEALIQQQAGITPLSKEQLSALKESVTKSIEGQLKNIKPDVIETWQQGGGHKIPVVINGEPYEIDQMFYTLLILHINTNVAILRLNQKFGEDSQITKVILKATDDERFIRPQLINYLTEHCSTNITPEELEKKLQAPELLTIREVITTYAEADACYQSLFYSQFLQKVKDKKPREAFLAVKTLNATLKLSSSATKAASKLIDSMSALHQVTTHSHMAKELKYVGGIISLVSLSISTLLDPLIWYINYKREGKKPGRWAISKWLGTITGLAIAAILFASIAGPVVAAALITVTTSISLIKTIGDFLAQDRQVKKLKKEISALEVIIAGNEQSLNRLKDSYCRNIKRLKVFLMAPVGTVPHRKILQLNEHISLQTKELNKQATQQQNNIHLLIQKKHSYHQQANTLSAITSVISKTAYTSAAIASVVGAAFLFIPPLAPVGALILGISACLAVATFTVSMINKGINHYINKRKTKKIKEEIIADPISQELSVQQQQTQKEYQQLFSYKFHKEKQSFPDDLFKDSKPLADYEDFHYLQKIQYELSFAENNIEACQILYQKRHFILKYQDEFLALVRSENLSLYPKVESALSMDIESVAKLDSRIAHYFFSSERGELAEKLSEKFPIPIYEKADIEQAREQNTKSLIESLVSAAQPHNR